MPKTTKTIRPPKPTGQGYCRMCEKHMALSNFYEATNPMIDKNQYMSICKDHCNEIYEFYFSLHNNLELALQLTCRDLDVRFSKDALIQTQSHIENLLSKGKNAEKVFGYYKSKLGSTGKKNGSIDSFRYKDSDLSTKQIKIDVDDVGEQQIDEDLIIFWGKGFSFDDISFLETELDNWKRTHKCDNQAELTLLKEICIKILIIRNKRANGDNVTQDLKDLQDLMKTASVDPAKANMASAGKSHDAFGVWIKDIEQFRPAEWFEDQEKYKDMDGFIPYIKNYIIRPIENFLTGVRNFFVDDNIDVNLDAIDENNNDGDSNG